jgi:hypothetical protein
MRSFHVSLTHFINAQSYNQQIFVWQEASQSLTESEQLLFKPGLTERVEPGCTRL